MNISGLFEYKGVGYGITVTNDYTLIDQATMFVTVSKDGLSHQYRLNIKDYSSVVELVRDAISMFVEEAEEQGWNKLRKLLNK